MIDFSEALTLMKKGVFVKRQVIKNDTVIMIYKNQLMQLCLSTGVRYPYVPTNEDLLAHDWQLI